MLSPAANVAGGKALGYGVAPLSAAIMGVVTATMGGIFRDGVAGVPSIILRPELYVTVAALAAGLFVALMGARLVLGTAVLSTADTALGYARAARDALLRIASGSCRPVAAERKAA